MKRFILLVVLLPLVMAVPSSFAANASSVFQIKMDEMYSRAENSSVSIPVEVSSSAGKVTYLRWRQISGPSVSITQVYSTPVLKFLSPSVQAQQPPVQLKFELLVKDDKANELASFTTVQIENINKAPEINLSLNGKYQPSSVIRKFSYLTEVIMDCSRLFDEDGDKISVNWQQISGINLTLAKPEQCRQTLILPASPSQYMFKLTATDERGLSSSKTVSFQAFPPLLSTHDHTLQSIYPPNKQHMVRYKEDLVIVAVNSSIKVYQFVAQTYFKLISEFRYSKVQKVIHLDLSQDKLFATLTNGGIYVFDIQDIHNISLVRQLPSFTKQKTSSIDTRVYTNQWVATAYSGFFKVWKFEKGDLKAVNTDALDSDGFLTTKLALAEIDNEPIFIRVKSKSYYGGDPKTLELYKVENNKLVLVHSLQNYASGYNDTLIVEKDILVLFYKNELTVVNLNDYSRKDFTLPLPNGHQLDRSYLAFKNNYLYFVHNTYYNQQPESGLSAFHLSSDLELNTISDIPLHYPQLSINTLFGSTLELLSLYSRNIVYLLDISVPSELKVNKVYSHSSLSNPQLHFKDKILYGQNLSLFPVEKKYLYQYRSDAKAIGSNGITVDPGILFHQQYYVTFSTKHQITSFDTNNPAKPNVIDSDNSLFNQLQDYVATYQQYRDMLLVIARPKTTTASAENTLYYYFSIDANGKINRRTDLETLKVKRYLGRHANYEYVQLHNSDKTSIFNTKTGQVKELSHAPQLWSNIYQGYTYNFNTQKELEVWAITGPETLKRVNKLATPSLTPTSERFKFVDNTLYLSANQDLYSINISNPTLPLELKLRHDSNYLLSTNTRIKGRGYDIDYSGIDNYIIDNQGNVLTVHKNFYDKLNTEYILSRSATPQNLFTSSQRSALNVKTGPAQQAKNGHFYNNAGSFRYIESDLVLKRAESDRDDIIAYQIQWQQDIPFINCETSAGVCKVTVDGELKQATVRWVKGGNTNKQWINIFAGSYLVTSHFTETIN